MPPITPDSLPVELFLPMATTAVFALTPITLVLPLIWEPPLMAPAVFFAVLPSPMATAAVLTLTPITLELPSTYVAAREKAIVFLGEKTIVMRLLQKTPLPSKWASFSGSPQFVAECYYS